jgi:galactonate dehydratase
VACVQLSASLPNFFLQEIFDDFNEPWERRLVDHPVEVVDGYIEIPDRPGLGIELNMEEIQRHPYHAENALPLFKRGWELRRTESSDALEGRATAQKYDD